LKTKKINSTAKREPFETLVIILKRTVIPISDIYWKNCVQMCVFLIPKRHGMQGSAQVAGVGAVFQEIYSLPMTQMHTFQHQHVRADFKNIRLTDHDC
jgi:hypothetical protein